MWGFHNAEAGKIVASHRFRVSEAAALLGVSDDTIRRWADSGRFAVSRAPGGRLVIDGADLAPFAQEIAEESRLGEAFPLPRSSTRNRFTGIVTGVVRDTVMAQVEVQAGRYRIVSLMSREAADELGLEIGSVVVAGVKATNVTIDVPQTSGDE